MRRISPKFPEVLMSLYRLGLWFLMRGGCLSNISGTIPWASSPPGFWEPCQAPRLGLSPRSPLGANASLPATLLCLYFPSSGFNQFRISTQDPGQMFPSGLVYIIIPLTFPKRRRSFPAPSRYHPRPGFHEAGAPTLAS